MERKKVSTCFGFSVSFSLGRGLGGLLVARMIFMMVRRFFTRNLLNREVCVCARERFQGVCELKPHLFFMAWPAEIVIALPQNRQPDRQTGTRSDRHMNKQTDRQTSRQTARQIDNRTDQVGQVASAKIETHLKNEVAIRSKANVNTS